MLRIGWPLPKWSESDKWSVKSLYLTKVNSTTCVHIVYQWNGVCLSSQDVIILLATIAHNDSTWPSMLFFLQSARDDLLHLNEYLSKQIREKESDVAQLRELVKKRDEDCQLAKKRAIHFKV